MVSTGLEQGSATRLGRWLGRAVRVAVVLLLLGGLLGSAVAAARRESLAALRDDLAAGRVTEVTFPDGTRLAPPDLDPDGTGPAVRWKVAGSGWRSASLTRGDVSDGGPAPGTGPGPGADDGTGPGPGPGPDDGTGVDGAQTSVEQLVRNQVRAAGVPVTTTTPRAPRLLISLATLASIALVLVLIGAPQPRRATKWAWFWLMLVPGGVTQLVWLAVEAPWSERANRLPEPLPDRQQPADTRLTGGRSFLISAVLGLVVGWLGGQLGGWLAN